MKPPANKLLATLGALGLTAGVSISDAEANATYGSFGEFFSYVSVSVKGDIVAKAEFARSYPNSPAAARLAKDIAAQLASMPPAARAAVARDIAMAGGLPGSVAAVNGLGDLAPAGIGPTNRPRGLDVARSRTDGVTNSPIY